MADSPLDTLIGQEIVAVEGDEHPVLVLGDGRRVTFEGIGYDELRTDVLIDIKSPRQP